MSGTVAYYWLSTRNAATVPAMQQVRTRLLLLFAVFVGVLLILAVLYMMGMSHFEGKERTFWQALLWAAGTTSTTGFGPDTSWTHPVMVVFVVITQFLGVVLIFMVLPRGSTGSKRVGWLILLSFLFLVDLFLFSANVLKIPEGGWLPLVVGIVVFTLMMIWRQGRRLLAELQGRDRQPLKEFMLQLEEFPPARAHGTAIFMTMSSGFVPPALLHNLKHNKVLHEQVLFLTIKVADVPFVSAEERFKVERVSHSSWQITVNYGFKEDSDVPEALRLVGEAYPELDLEPMRTSFFLSRQTVVGGKRAIMPRWRRAIFAFMARNGMRSTKFFKIPPNRVVEMGMQVEL